ncbi:MAG: type III-A CRISPR-associated RAMP protein Csm5, partial [Bacteroidetes bacterium]
MPQTLYLHTYSPIHIGTGASLEPAEYELVRGVFYRLHPERLFGAVLDQHSDASSRLMQWIEERAKKQDRTVDNRVASELRRQSLFDFVEKQLYDAPLARRLENDLAAYSVYAMPGPAALQSAVREQLKTATGELYIPGSSIKGMLRTALLYRALKGPDPGLRGVLKQALQRAARMNWQDRQKRRKMANDLEARVLGCGVQNNRRMDYDDPRFSLTRFLVVSDTEARPAAEIGRVVNVDLYLLDGQKQNQAPPVEAIREGVTLPFRLGIDLAGLREILEGIRQQRSVKIGGNRLVLGTEAW